MSDEQTAPSQPAPDDSPAPPADKVDELTGALLGFARRMLDDHGEFFPFAGAVTTSDEIELYAADAGGNHPEAGAVMDVLYEGLIERADSGLIHVSGVCVDVTIATPERGETDAVQLSLERAGGEPLEVYLPYRRADGDIAYDELVATTGQRRVFDRPSPG